MNSDATAVNVLSVSAKRFNDSNLSCVFPPYSSVYLTAKAVSGSISIIFDVGQSHFGSHKRTVSLGISLAAVTAIMDVNLADLTCNTVIYDEENQIHHDNEIENQTLYPKIYFHSRPNLISIAITTIVSFLLTQVWVKHADCSSVHWFSCVKKLTKNRQLPPYSYLTITDLVSVTILSSAFSEPLRQVLCHLHFSRSNFVGAVRVYHVFTITDITVFTSFINSASNSIR